MFNRIKAVYGDRLDEEQLRGVEEALDKIIANLEQIRTIPLCNSDEPIHIFKPHRRSHP